MIPMWWIVLFCSPSFVVVAALPLCISSYRFELWVPIERHGLGMHILLLSLNVDLPLYNTILANFLHELSKAQFLMLLTLCAPVLVLYRMYAYITYICYAYPYAANMSKMALSLN